MGRRPASGSNSSKNDNIARNPIKPNDTAGEQPEAGIEVKVGKKLSSLRQERGLSLRALSERSGLAINTLSMIEKGKTSPSISTLQQLAHVLEIPIAFFFENEKVERNIVYLRRQQRTKGVFNNTSMEFLGKDFIENAVQPFVVNLEPGSWSGRQMIFHSGYEFVYCLTGQVLFVIDEQNYLLEPGDSIVFVSEFPHRYQNVGPAESSFLLVRVPGSRRDLPVERFMPMN